MQLPIAQRSLNRVAWIDPDAPSQPSAGPDPLFLRRPVEDDLIVIGGFQREIDRLRLFRGQVELPHGLVHVGCAN